jgi:hypothetical protein
VDQTGDSLDGVCHTDGTLTGSCNLRAAIAAAGGGASVAVTAVQSITLGEITVPAGTNVAVVGTTADATALYTETQSGLFHVVAGATLSLAEVSVRNFQGFSGGAIRSEGSLTLDGVEVSDNTARCSSTGAMTSNANCWGGAIVSSGKLVLRGGTSFYRNVVTASSSTATFTNAIANGGALVNSGELLIDGPVTFGYNTADATASSGFHGQPGGSATASAAGGAIWHTGGSLTVTGAAVGHCSFTNNSAIASATNADGTSGMAASAGGAIWSQATLNIPNGACTFSENSAQTDPDVHVQH